MPHIKNLCAIYYNVMKNVDRKSDKKVHRILIIDAFRLMFAL